MGNRGCLGEQTHRSQHLIIGKTPYGTYKEHMPFQTVFRKLGILADSQLIHQLYLRWYRASRLDGLAG